MRYVGRTWSVTALAAVLAVALMGAGCGGDDDDGPLGDGGDDQPTATSQSDDTEPTAAGDGDDPTEPTEPAANGNGGGEAPEAGPNELVIGDNSWTITEARCQVDTGGGTRIAAEGAGDPEVGIGIVYDPDGDRSGVFVELPDETQWHFQNPENVELVDGVVRGEGTFSHIFTSDPESALGAFQADCEE